jgi:hypothetical protein
MRLRFALLAALALPVIAAVAPGTTNAAQRVTRGLTIAATPNPVPAGNGVLVYGQLNGPDHAGQTINLFHHLDGSHHDWTMVGQTTTTSTGFYRFPRAEGVVWTNRSWYVTGPDGTRSRVIHESVRALVSLQASTTSAFTKQPVLFTGTVTPNHTGEDVLLQQRVAPGDHWKTIDSGEIGAGSAFSISHEWARPGVHDVRAVFPGDVRNIRGVSDPVTVNIQQQQVPDFTIASSQPLAPAGSTVTISGTLYMPGTTTPEPNTPVQLWGRITSQHGFTVVGNTTTDSQGDYSFMEANETYNTVYYAATLKAKGVKVRQTARLFQGVQDALTLLASATNVTVGQQVTFTGSVLPDKAGETIYLEQQGTNGKWQVIRDGLVRHNSTYQFKWTPGAPGTFTFRTRILGDGLNVGARSGQVTITATLPPPPAS